MAMSVRPVRSGGIGGSAAGGWQEAVVACMAQEDRSYNPSVVRDLNLCSVSSKPVSRETGSLQGNFWITGMSRVQHSLSIRSVGGSSRHDTPPVVPSRGHLDTKKRLMTGDVYIGRGSSQRSLSRSIWCNSHKVLAYGRDLVIQKFSDYLWADTFLLSAVWTLSGCRLVCHCTPDQRCHGDFIIEAYRYLFPLAFDREVPSTGPPSSEALSYLAHVRYR